MIWFFLLVHFSPLSSLRSLRLKRWLGYSVSNDFAKSYIYHKESKARRKDPSNKYSCEWDRADSATSMRCFVPV